MEDYFGQKEMYSTMEYQIAVELEIIKQKDVKRMQFKEFLKVEEKIDKGGSKYITDCWRTLTKNTRITEKEAQIYSEIWPITPEEIKNIVHILAKETNKVNTICFWGPSNAGKSILQRSIMKPWEPGSIQRDGGMNLHWLENTIFKTFIVWEEPIVNCEIKEDMKLVLGGERVTVNPKNKPLLYKEHRSPLVITTNIPFWMSDTTGSYLNRMYIIKLSNLLESKTDKHIDELSVLKWLVNLYDRSTIGQ